MLEIFLTNAKNEYLITFTNKYFYHVELIRFFQKRTDAQTEAQTVQKMKNIADDHEDARRWEGEVNSQPLVETISRVFFPSFHFSCFCFARKQCNENAMMNLLDIGENFGPTPFSHFLTQTFFCLAKLISLPEE